jgi:PAS domain S-box-containing protein
MLRHSGIIWHLAESASEAQRKSLQYAARSVATAVDAKLGEYITLAQLLSRSPALMYSDLAAFDAEARRAFASIEDGWVVVADLEGRQLINTARPVGAPLPTRNPAGLAAQRHAFETRSTVISDIQFGNVSKAWIVNIEVPVIKDGVPFRALSVGLKAESFLHLLNDQQIPKNWIATIIDREGRVIARVPYHDQRVGQLAAEGWRKVMNQNGVFEFLSLEGDSIVSAHARSSASGWLAGVKILTAEMHAAVWSTIRWAAAAGAGLSIMSLLLAGALSRRITRPIAEIRLNAAKLLTGSILPMAEAPPEIGDLWLALNEFAAARLRSDRALRESKERLQLALDAAQLGTWRRWVTKGAEGIECDARCRALLGLPDAGLPLSYGILANAILPEDRGLAKAAVERALDPADPRDEYGCEYRVKHSDGTVLWLSARGRAFFEPDLASHSGRRAIFIAGALRDVTEAHLARATRESEERLRHLGDSLPESAVYRYAHAPNRAPSFHYISAGIEHLNGVHVEDVLRDARILLGQILPEYLPEFEEAERRSAADMSDFKIEVPMRRPDGEVRWMRLQSRPHRNQDGAIIWDGVQTDITDWKRAEEAVRESEEKLRFALDAAEVGTWRWEAAATAGELQWDARSKALFGLPHNAHVTWETWANSILAEDRDQVEANVARALDPADPIDETACEFRVRHPDGKVLWLSSTGRAFFELDPGSSSGRRAVFKSGVIRDVTDIRSAEAELRRSEERLRLSNEAAGIGTFTIDPEAGCIHYSPELAARLGFPGVGSAKIEDAFTRVHRDDLSCVRSQLEAGLNNGGRGEIRADFRFVLPGGEVRWMTWAGRVHFREGIPFRVDGACVDITERKQAEVMLRQSEERFRGIFEHAGTGIAILDMDHRFECCNPAYSKILGYSEEELRELAFLSHVHPEDRDANAAQCERLLAEEIPHFEIVNRYVRKDGTPIWVDKHVSLLRDAAGKPTNILTLATDVTERKRQEDQIRLLMREVNHRSKNMLSLVQAIARQTLAANPDDFLDRFGKRVEALAANQDLLVKSAWKGADLNELVRSQLATFEELIGSNIMLEGPPLFVSAPAAQALGMALHELVTNAGKYGALSGGGGRLNIAWCIQRNEEGKELFIMSWREHCAHPIMPPCKQGFGSFVISKMAEMSLGAYVELDYPPSGLSWQLKCAAGEVMESSVGPVPTVEKENSGAASDEPTSRRPRVLVVEDEALVAVEITHALTLAGFDVVGPARNVPAALQFLKCSGCDAAVLDINLSGETSEAIAIELAANKTPFVTLSGYSPEQHHPVFGSAPAFRKPLSFQLLIAELCKCIEHRDSRSRERPGDLPIEALGVGVLAHAGKR